MFRKQVFWYRSYIHWRGGGNLNGVVSTLAVKNRGHLKGVKKLNYKILLSEITQYVRVCRINYTNKTRSSKSKDHVTKLTSGFIWREILRD